MKIRIATISIMALILIMSISLPMPRHIANAETETTWAKSYGGLDLDEARSIQQTSDGGYIVAGFTSSFGAGSHDFLVIKLDSNGDVQWEKTYGGSGFDQARSIQQTSDGGYVVAGEITISGLDHDFWVIKLDSNGNLEWQKAYGGSGLDFANSVQQTSDGGYIVAGFVDVFGEASGDFWILKLNQDGDIEWQKSYGGGGSDEAFAIQQTSDGGYVIAGRAALFAHLWILKLDSNGDVVWQKSYGGAFDFAASIQQTSDGGYIVAGQIESLEDVFGDIWILKLDSNGDVVWQKSYGGPGFGSDGARSIQQTSDGGYIVAGFTDQFDENDNIWILKLDSNGNVEWERAYGDSSFDFAYAVQQTSDGGYIVAGETNSFSAVEIDFWILKLDHNGSIFNCTEDIIQDTSATVVNTSSAATDTSATVVNTSVVATDTSATVTDPTASVNTQCGVDLGDAIQDLINDVNNMDLPDKIQRNLTGPLHKATKLLNDDNPNNDLRVCKKLDKFIHKVNAKEAKGKLTATQADELRQSAQDIKASLGCP